MDSPASSSSDSSSSDSSSSDSSFSTDSDFSSASPVPRRIGNAKNNEVFRQVITCVVNAGYGPEVVKAASVCRAVRFDPELWKKVAPLQRDSKKRTAMMAAARFGRLERMKWLKARGASHTVKDSDGNTALHWAAVGGHRDAEDWLLDQLGTDIEAKNNKRETALHLAAELGKESVVDLLCEGGADCNPKDRSQETPLIKAVRKHHLAAVHRLLAENADPDAKSGLRWSALSIACRFDFLDCIEALAERGAALEGTSSSDSPFRAACESGKDKAALKLLDLGLGPNSGNDTGKSLLCVACRYGRTKVIKRLLELKADPNSSNSIETALFRACHTFQADKIIPFLVKAGADLEQTAFDELCLTPLSLASFLGNAGAVEALLKAGASVDATTFEDKSSVLRVLFAELDFLFEDDDFSDLDAPSNRAKVIDLLLAAGARVDREDDQLNTPLHLAAAGKHQEDLAVKLAEAGADLEAENRAGKTPIQVAKEKGNTSLAAKLEAIAADKKAKEAGATTAGPLVCMC